MALTSFPVKIAIKNTFPSVPSRAYWHRNKRERPPPGGGELGSLYHSPSPLSGSAPAEAQGGPCRGAVKEGFVIITNQEGTAACWVASASWAAARLALASMSLMRFSWLILVAPGS